MGMSLESIPVEPQPKGIEAKDAVINKHESEVNSELIIEERPGSNELVISDASSSSDEGVFGLKITGVEQYWKGGAKADVAAP